MKPRAISSATISLSLLVAVVCVNFFAFSPIIVRGVLMLYALYEIIFMGNHRYPNKVFKYYGFFVLYYCTSILWGNGLLAVGYTFSCLVSVLAITLFFTSSLKSISDIERMLTIFIALMIFSFISLVIVTPVSSWGTERIGDNIGVNANTLGLNAAYSIMYVFYFSKSKNNNKILFFIIPLMLLVLLSGSRKAIFVAMAGLGLFYYITSTQKNKIRTIITILVGCFILYYIIMHNEILYNILGKRIEAMNRDSGIVDGSYNKREFFRQYAMGMFKEKKLLGWGAEGFRMEMQRINYPKVAYSHCNYTELLANFGIVGFILYYGPIVSLTIKYISNIKTRKDNLHIVFLAIMIMSFFVDYGSVTYYSIDNWIRIICAYSYLKIECSLKGEDNNGQNYISISKNYT